MSTTESSQKKNQELKSHYLIEYQDIYPTKDYSPIIFLLFILFIVIYFIALFKKIN
jgi:hypothetical protein